MGDTWNKNCEVLVNPLGPFSQCHKVVPPEVSFTSCVHGQCGTKGDSLTLCRSLQAYASLCSLAGQAIAWRTNTFCRECPRTCSCSLESPDPCPLSDLSSAPLLCPAQPGPGWQPQVPSSILPCSLCAAQPWTPLLPWNLFLLTLTY